MSHNQPSDLPGRLGFPSLNVADRLTVDVRIEPGEGPTLADDVRAGLVRPPRVLPPRHFYDAHGSRLFDAICDLPEYYLTRSEQALLDRVAPALVAALGPTDELLELGSGAARKTTTLLDALLGALPGAPGAAAPGLRYVPLDISETMLRASAAALLARYPTLRVDGVVGDYERHLGGIARRGRRLVAFLGSTIGNFDAGEAERFLRVVAGALAPGDHLLLGVDLVKDHAALHRAYDDARGLTAEFNRNVLRVINRELGARFDPARFDHVALYDPVTARIEMHLRAREAMDVDVPGAGVRVALGRGEAIRTEISRKFTRASVAALLADAGLALVGWEVGADPVPAAAGGVGDGAFALALCRPSV